MSMASNKFAVSDHDIKAVSLAINDRSCAQHLGVDVKRVEKVRAEMATLAAQNARDGRRKLRPEPVAINPHDADAPLDLGVNQFDRQAPEGCTRLLAAHLAYHAKHHPRSKLPPLSHAGTPTVIRCRNPTR